MSGPAKRINLLKCPSGVKAAGIMLSFESKWEQALRAGEISVVFRKKGPLLKGFSYLYAYVGLPTCSVIGRAKVRDYERLSVPALHGTPALGQISARELQVYDQSTELGVFHLGQFEVAPNQIGLASLLKKFGCAAPQNYFFLAEEGKTKLDELAGFSE